MDLTRTILFRDYTLNDENILANIVAGNGAGAGISGCVVDSADMSDVDVVQFLEKRSLSDGMDAGDVYLGARRLRMAGTLYATTRALLFDAYQNLRAALSPTLAQRESPADKGYLPLYFSVPTNRIEDYPDQVINQRVLVLPRAFQAIFNRDQSGGDDLDALALPWQATFIMRDPRIMSEAPWDHDFAALAASDAGDFVNRGDYHAPLNILLVVDATAGSAVFSAGGSVFTITVPASTGNRTIRYKGEDKLLTVEESGVETVRMDLLTFQNQTTHPLVPGGTSPYSATFTSIQVQDGSHMWFWESFA